MPSLPRPGDRLAGFRIERELGHGTTGVVYLAHQEDLDRRVALKVVGRPLADDAAFRERFRREARAVAGLDHPNVVQILETGEDDAHLWLAMRLVDGPDLRVLLRRTGRLDPEQAVAVVGQVAAALDAAHAAGLVHRDVKPGNVLIEDGPGRDLHVELADFGLARAPGVDDAEGTPGYAAPEQLAGAEAGPAADVFALGCVLFELLTGEAPPAPAAPVDQDVPWRRGPGGAGVGVGGDGGGVSGAWIDDPAAWLGDPEDAGPEATRTPRDEPGPSRGDASPTNTPPAAAPPAADPAVVAAYAALLPLTPSAARPRLGGAFDPAVERATAADPAARFASAGELAMWARAALTVPRATLEPEDPVRVAAATPASPAEVERAAPTWEIPPPRRRRRGRRLLAALLLALVLALLGTAFVFIGSLGDSSRDRRAGTTPGAPTPAGGGAAPGRAGASSRGGGAGGSSSGGAGGSSREGGAGGSSSGRAGGSSREGGAGGSSSGGSGVDGGLTGGAGAASGTSRAGTGGAGPPVGGGSSGGASGSGSGSSSGGTGTGSSSSNGNGNGAGGRGAGAGGSSGPGGGRGASSGGTGRAARGAGGGVPDAGPRAPTGATTAPLPPVPAGYIRFGGGGWVLDLPAAERWRQTATQELDGGARLVTRLGRADAVRLVVESLPGRTAVVGAPGARPFPVRLPDAGRTDGFLFRGGRYAMCASGVCAALPANGPSGGVLVIVGAHRAAGAKRVARRAAAGLRVR